MKNIKQKLHDKADSVIRNDWDLQEILDLFALPFNDLLYKASTIHRQNFDPNQVQVSTLMSIKTGGCPEDCKYCPQSAHYNTFVEKEQGIATDEIVKAATAAKDSGATRFCMGAAWRSLNDRDVPYMEEVVSKVKDLGLEVCVTLGMAKEDQLKKLKDAGLDYYNHNIDSSEEFYKKVISTRDYQDRLDTLENVKNAGLNTCCGGIVGMGETVKDRAGMVQTIANMDPQPRSVPINMLVKVEGTPLEDQKDLDYFDFVRTIAVARIVLPKSYVRLSAGREQMNDQMQAMCFFAGANSIFYGEKLLTTKNPNENKDIELINKLGMHIENTNADTNPQLVNQ